MEQRRAELGPRGDEAGEPGSPSPPHGWSTVGAHSCGLKAQRASLGDPPKGASMGCGLQTRVPGPEGKAGGRLEVGRTWVWSGQHDVAGDEEVGEGRSGGGQISIFCLFSLYV